MRTRSKLLLAGLTVTLLLSVGVSTASAGRLSVSNRFFRVTWRNLLLENAATREALIECPVTIEGSFHSATIQKVRGALIGHVSRATLKNESCTGGRATILRESLPWHVTFDSFIGALPNITGIRLLLHRVAFNVEIFFVNCLYADQGGANENLRGIVNREAGGNATVLSAEDGESIGLVRGGFACPERGTFGGDGNVMLLGNTERIRITLI